MRVRGVPPDTKLRRPTKDGGEGELIKRNNATHHRGQRPCHRLRGHCQRDGINEQNPGPNPMISVTRPNPSYPDQVDDETASSNEQSKTSATTSRGLVDARYKRRARRKARGGGESRNEWDDENNRITYPRI